MLDPQLTQKLTPIFQDVFDRDDLVLTPELSSSDVEEWDSLSNIRLFVAIEQEFGVRFTTDEITALNNVGELADLMTRKGI
ncbi:acyl carrier protein [Oleispirillum naphthae]|uniref:acyl carrier protein n=1 Tax=Oleispirillum naphthae TaxID=2838853 RepID=UPI0030823D8A